MNYFINILFGHLVGDFFIQPKAMAVKKGASTWIALGHVALYTFAIAVFTSFSWKWLLFVFITHFIVDRWSLADKWLQFIRGRDLPGFVTAGQDDIPDLNKDFSLNKELRLNYRILRGSFSSIVYTVVDNTIHLMTMYYAYPYLT